MTTRTLSRLTLTTVLTLGFAAAVAGSAVACPQGGGFGRGGGYGGGRGAGMGLYGGRNRQSHSFAQNHATQYAYRAKSTPNRVATLPAAPVASTVVTTQSTNTSNVMLTSYENHTNVGSTLGYGLYPGYVFPVATATPAVQAPELESLPVETPVAETAAEQTASPSDAFESASTTVAAADEPGVAPKIVVIQTMNGTQPELLVQGDNFGSQTGRVYFVLGAVRLALDVAAWDGAAVRVKLPTVEVTSDTTTRVVVTRADGVASDPYELTNAPAATVAAN